MPEMTQFRAALHGFNREDVVAYIDRLNLEHEEQLSQLREENQQLQHRLEAANQALAEAGEKEGLEQELNLAKAQIADLSAKAEELEHRNQELQAAAAQAAEAAPEELPEARPVTQDLAEPIPPVPQVLPVNVAPSKDYTELELAAYRRAELAERLARERASDVYRQIQSVFNRADTKLDTGKADLEQLTGALREDVNQLLNLLNNIHSAYDEAEQSFAEVSQRNRQLMEDEEAK